MDRHRPLWFVASALLMGLVRLARMWVRARLFFCVLVEGCIFAGGCAPPERVPLFTPMPEAVAIFEANRRLIHTGLRARGSVRGYFRDGKSARRHYDLEAKLLVLPPDHLRFVMEHVLGGDELRVGMNSTKWWIWVRRPEQRELEGRRGQEEDDAGGSVLVDPEQLMQALGLNALPLTNAVQRVTAEYQQIIVVAPEGDRKRIEKEYWLDRYEPRLVRRIVFRDSEGQITLSSELDRYAPVAGDGLLLPYILRLRWPEGDAEMVFRVDRWREDSSVTVDHPAFIAPSDRHAALN